MQDTIIKHGKVILTAAKGSYSIDGLAKATRFSTKRIYAIISEAISMGVDIEHNTDTYPSTYIVKTSKAQIRALYGFNIEPKRRNEYWFILTR